MMVDLRDLAYGPDEQKREIARWLNEQLGDHTQFFSGPAGRDMAVAMATQQEGRWKALLSFTAPTKLSTNSGAAAQLSRIREVLLKSLEAGARTEGERSIARSTLPLILNDPTEDKVDLLAMHPSFSMATVLRKSSSAIAARDDAAILAFVTAIE